MNTNNATGRGVNTEAGDSSSLCCCVIVLMCCVVVWLCCCVVVPGRPVCVQAVRLLLGQRHVSPVPRVL